MLEDLLLALTVGVEGLLLFGFRDPPLFDAVNSQRLVYHLDCIIISPPIEQVQIIFTQHVQRQVEVTIYLIRNREWISQTNKILTRIPHFHEIYQIQLPVYPFKQTPLTQLVIVQIVNLIPRLNQK